MLNMLQLVENGMPTKYLDEEGLSHVVDLAKKKFADKKELWNWQKTEKAGAVAFTPVPDSVLEPVVEFKFKETLPAEGEKGPDNPSTIEGVDSINVTRCGKNLVSPNLKPQGSQYVIGDNVCGIVTTRTEDRRLVLNGTADNNEYYNYTPIGYFPQGMVYTLSGFPATADANDFAQIYGVGGTQRDYGQGITYTQTEPQATGQLLTVRLIPGSQVSNLVWSVQLELGSEITEYEEPVSDTYTVNLGSTYYGGTLDLATGVMTVMQEAQVIDGTETWYKRDDISTEQVSVFYSNLNLPNNTMKEDMSESTRLCSHFSYNSNIVENTFFTWGYTSRVYFKVPASSFPDVSDFKSWLSSEYEAEHPVTIVYTKYTPAIVQLTPTEILSLIQTDKYEPRINTIYTDAEAVQVGYQKFTAEGNFVHTTGNETINGVKSFANSEINDSEGTTTVVNIRNPSVTRGVRLEDGRSWTQLLFLDANGNQQDQSGRLGMFELCSPSAVREDSHEYMQFSCYRFSDSLADRYKRSSLNVGFDPNGIPYAQVSSTSEERDEPTDIVTRDYLPKSKAIPQFSDLLNWQKTDENQFVSFNPASESAIEPIIKFKFSESLPAEGEKDLNNPSTINPVSSIKLSISGKNLGATTAVSDDNPVNGISFIVNEDNTITVNSTESTNERYFTIKYVPVPAGTYTLSGCPSGGTSGTYFLTAFYTGQPDAIRDYGNKVTFTINEPKIIQISICIRSGITLSNLVFKPQLESGDIATSFEAYTGTTMNISLQNSYYGGILNVASGILTVTHHAFIPSRSYIQTATVTATTDANLWQVYLGKFSASYKPEVFNYSNNAGYGGIDYRCNYLNWDRVGNVKSFHVSNGFAFASFEGSTAEEARQNCLSFYDETVANNNPLTIVYPLATPYTVQLSPQQIKSIPSINKYIPQLNVVYTDADLVQVGYQRFVDDANVVHKTSDENVEGYKIFSNSHVTDPESSPHVLVSSIGIKNNNLLKGVVPEYSRMLSLQLMDSTGTDVNHSGRLASFEYQSPNETNASYRTYMRCWKYLSGDDPHITDGVEISVGYDDNGNVYASAPAISNNRTNSTDIVTRGWRISESEIDELSIS